MKIYFFYGRIIQLSCHTYALIKHEQLLIWQLATWKASNWRTISLAYGKIQQKKVHHHVLHRYLIWCLFLFSFLPWQQFSSKLRLLSDQLLRMGQFRWYLNRCIGSRSVRHHRERIRKSSALNHWFRNWKTRHLLRFVRLELRVAKNKKQFTHDGSSWDFNHCSKLVFDLFSSFLLNFRVNLFHHCLLVLELSAETHQRNHHLRKDIRFGCCPENRSALHFGDLRQSDSQSASAPPEHRIELMQFLDLVLQHSWLDLHFCGNLQDIVFFFRQELVERWVQSSNGHWLSAHHFEQSFEIFHLEFHKLIECLFPFVDCVWEDHLSHGLDSGPFEEHVFSSAEANALGAEFNGVFCILGSVRIGSDSELSDFVCPGHELKEVGGSDIRIN